ncbi:MAG: hypothetical protein WBG76_11855 [Ornithinimicrobium sp.]
MASERLGLHSTALALAGFIIPAGFILWLWASNDLTWFLAIPPLTVVAGAAVFTYVLARRGD